jgi:hypothetical protein
MMEPCSYPIKRSEAMTIWDFQRFVSRALLGWSGVSAALGLLIGAGRTPFARGVSGQFLGWPVINSAIALFGAFSVARRERRLSDAQTPARRATEARNLRRLLRINAALDVGYMAGGLWLFTRKDRPERLRGAGLGILLQGAFLCVFDAVLSLRVPDAYANGD